MSKYSSISITVPHELRRLAQERSQATVLRQKELGIWHACSGVELLTGIDEVAAGLLNLGVKPGEVVGIVSSACRDWVLADLGGLSAAAVVAALHASDHAVAIHGHLRDLDIRVLFVEDVPLFESIVQAGALPRLQHAIVFRTEGLRRTDDARLQGIAQLREQGREALARDPQLVERSLSLRHGTDDAIAVATAGTSGTSRMVRLSHQAVLFAAQAASNVLPPSEGGNEERLLFLPLSQAVERTGAFYAALLQGAILNFAEGQDTVFDNLREVRPHVLQGVPRFWEKLRSRLVLELNEATTAEQWCYRRALGAQGGALRSVLDVLVLSNLRRLLGLDRLRVGVIVGGPVSAEMLAWFRSLGVDLRAAWSCAELGGYVSLAGADDPLDSVGRPLPGLDIRQSGEGELLVRSSLLPSMDRWLPTGDLGRIDPDGLVQITGRRDDTIVTAGGQRVEPAELEQRIRASPFIADVIVVGHDRPHLACLVVLDRDTVEQWAQKHQVPFSDLRSLCESAAVGELIAREVQRTAGAAHARSVETIRLIEVAADGDPGTYTPALALKRTAVVQRFGRTIDGLYRPAASI